MPSEMKAPLAIAGVTRYALCRMHPLYSPNAPVGSGLSGALSGAQIGSMFGGPGAAIGAGVGGLVGLLGGR